MKKAVSLFLALVMLVSNFPLAALAEEIPAAPVQTPAVTEMQPTPSNQPSENPEIPADPATPEPSPEPEATAQPTAEPTPVPDPTQAPTPEPTVAPTATPEPTVAPTPTAEPTQAPQALVLDNTREATADGSFTYTVLSDGTAMIDAYTGDATEVTVPAEIDGYTVSRVDDSAFSGNADVTAVHFADTITQIGERCFYNCTALSEVTLPVNLEVMGRYAFWNCPALTAITIPKTLERVDGSGGVFTGTTNLKNVTFAEGTTILVGSLFRDCTSLETITIPEGVTEIRNNAFAGASNLKTVSLPQSLTRVDSYAFSGCTSLTGPLDLPDSVTNLGEYAFASCSVLSDVTLPANLEVIGRYAFWNCPALTAITIPKTLERVDGSGGVFTGTTNLKNVTFAEGTTILVGSLFRDCTSLETITIPEGVTEIRNNAFAGASNLKTVSLPQSLTRVDSYAFSGCTSLTGPLDLPDSVTNLGEYAFASCSVLSDVTLPANLEVIGMNAFQNCPALTAINVPRTLERVNGNGGVFTGTTGLKTVTFDEGAALVTNRLFQNCTQLENVLFPETLTEIRSNAFYGCTALKHIELPDSLNTIGSYAFGGCTGLDFVYLPFGLTKTLDNVFSGCPDLTVVAQERSVGTMYAIQNKLPLQLLSTGEAQKESLKQVYDETGLTVNTSTAMSKGYVSAKVSYSFKDEEVQGMNLGIANIEVYIPENMEFVDNSVSSNGTPDSTAGYNESTRILTLRCYGQTGSSSFTMRPIATGSVGMYAYIDYWTGKGRQQEVLGVVNEELPALTVLADERVVDTFTVSGVGPASTTVSLYIDGTQAGQAQTNRAGLYQCELTLPNPENYTYYTLTAKAVDGETPCEAERTVWYRQDTPELTRCELTYRGETYDMLDTEAGKVVATFVNHHYYDLRFVVDYEGKDQIENVYVCSTRGGIKTRMEAVWDEQVQAYVAEGTFQDTVPGTLTVEYREKGSTLLFDTPIDYSSPRYVNGSGPEVKALTEEIRNGGATVTYSGWSAITQPTARSTDDPFTAALTEERTVELKFPEGVPTLEGTLKYLLKRGAIEIVDEAETREQLQKYGFVSYTDNNGTEVFTRFLNEKPGIAGGLVEEGTGYVVGEIVDMASGKIEQVVLDAGKGSIAANMDSFLNISQVFGYANDIIDWDNNRMDLNEARRQVLDSDRTAAEKTAALERLDDAQTANYAVAAATILSIGMSVAGVAMPFPAGLVLALYTMQQQAYVDEVLGEDSLFTNLSESTLRDVSWIIDPAGYVYDARTEQRLQDVTVTAYWVEADPNATAEEYEAFWATPPAADEYGQLWNAQEWGQQNPLQTDVDGYYQWDVPEGWWRVKYEKEGYQTAWSDWLPVPPPQTEVNIGLVPEMGDAITSDTYEIAGGVLFLPQKTTADALLANLLGTDITITAFDGTPVTGSQAVGTGATLAQGDGAAELSVVFYGDLSGNGSVDSDDLLQMRRSILKLITLDGVWLQAATPLDHGKMPSDRELLQMRRILLKLADTMVPQS